MTLNKKVELIIVLNINPIKTHEVFYVVLLGLTVDNCLTFKDHIKNLSRTAEYKHAKGKELSDVFF